MNVGFREDLINEFKSDLKRLPDSDLIDAVVAFANTEGGDLYLGVEDDGEITGLHKEHQDITQLAAFIANKTVPPIAVRAEKTGDKDKPYLKISVPKSRSIVASSSGKIQRRRIKADGTPENVPMYPHEIATRLSDLSLLDYSGLCVPDAQYSDLDPVERERLRNIIRMNPQGEQNLLELDDEELDKALRLVSENNGRLVPTYCGMLLIGRTDSLRRCVPTAEAAFQVLNGTNVVLNESFILPLLAAFEKIETYVNARNPESEIEDGFFRISVPDYNKRAFREALVNAFSHRDYTMMGRVRVLMDDDGMTISNPGGFIEGVTIENLLTVEPHGRNTALADALKRIGLAERTGRGVDRIFEGSLLYGKPLPDYSESTSTNVKLFIPKSLPDANFTRLISEEHRTTGESLPINSLLILNALKRNRRATVSELADFTHITVEKARITAERLVESGLIEASGNGKGRYYTLSAKLYQTDKNMTGYVRQKGIDKVRHPEMVMQFARENGGTVTRGDVMELLRLSKSQAYNLLKKMVEDGKLVAEGSRRNAFYKLKNE
ncbi:MAG: putative DNA binding domain-containing protein [Oscillospiraceae bacterium]|nr:putative DNA binding domain-containing protein [Oscillospiraceae bacterium]